MLDNHVTDFRTEKILFFYHVRQNPKCSECGSWKQGMFGISFAKSLYLRLQVQPVSYYERLNNLRV